MLQLGLFYKTKEITPRPIPFAHTSVVTMMHMLLQISWSQSVLRMVSYSMWREHARVLHHFSWRAVFKIRRLAVIKWQTKQILWWYAPHSLQTLHFIFLWYWEAFDVCNLCVKCNQFAWLFASFRIIQLVCMAHSWAFGKHQRAIRTKMSLNIIRDFK